MRLSPERVRVVTARKRGGAARVAVEAAVVVVDGGVEAVAIAGRSAPTQLARRRRRRVRMASIHCALRTTFLGRPSRLSVKLAGIRFETLM